MSRRATARATVAVATAVAALAAGSAAVPRTTPPRCEPPRAHAAYTARVLQVLGAGRDVWGEQLLRERNGATYAAASRFLGPLLLAGGPQKRPLTASGFHYVPFALPTADGGASTFALHLADGSGVVDDRVGGRKLTVFAGGERFGSCFGRLTPGRLAQGWLPILRIRYVDSDGNVYEQESFAARIPGRRRLASFVRVTAHARADTTVRLAIEGGAARVLRVRAGRMRTLRVAWERGRELRLVSETTFEDIRRATATSWWRRIGAGAAVRVPERVVMDAYRAVLAQNLTLTWRYSAGNPYEQFSFPEGLDAAQIMAEWGRESISRAIVQASLDRRPQPYANWKKAEKLVAASVHYRLFRDRAWLEALTPTLREYVEEFGRQLAASRRGLLARERYSSDVAETVWGLHSQAVAWQGLRGLAAAWAESGHADLAGRARRLAGQLEAGLRRAVARSQRRLPDGSLFVPVSLLGNEQGYTSLTEARLGSYWNLVMPYALASGLFPPHSVEADGIFRYMRLHGSRLLGLVRAGAYALYTEPRFPTSGTDEVYGINVARFLADADEADQLVLALYGHLAVAMAPGTFVGGEAASVAPIGGALLRTTYLPPNSASNGAFLTKLRLMLVHEPRGASGEPTGLRLAFATPRAWLRLGAEIAVRRMPTSFGPLSYELRATRTAVRATIDVPMRPAPPTLALRLRLPAGRKLISVRVAGRRHTRYDARTGTIDLSGMRGRIELEAETTG